MIFLANVSSHSGKIRLWWGVINYFEGSCTIVLELLVWNFCELSAISCNETRDGQLLKVSLLSEKVFLVFSFPYSLSPITVFHAYYVLPTHSKHAFFPPLCVYLSVWLPFLFLLTIRLCAALKKQVWKNDEWPQVSTFWICLFISLTLNVLYLSTIANTISIIISLLSEFFPYSMLFV